MLKAEYGHCNDLRAHRGPGSGKLGNGLGACGFARRPRCRAVVARCEGRASDGGDARQSAACPDVAIDKRIAITSSLADALKADAILAAVPAQSLRSLASLIAPSLPENIPVISCAKGIERGTHKFMTEIIADAAPRATPAILSGPSFAADVARGLPTAVTLGAADETIAADLAQSARLGDLPALSHDRLARRRDRRRGQERARDRDRHRVGTRPGRQCRGGACHARLCGACALRTQAWRTARNARPACPASAISC